MKISLEVILFCMALILMALTIIYGCIMFFKKKVQLKKDKSYLFFFCGIALNFVLSLYLLSGIDTKDMHTTRFPATMFFLVVWCDVLSLVMFIRLLDYVFSERKQKELEMLNAAYENQIQKIKESIEKEEYFRHDIKNHLGMIRELAQNNRLDELLNYVNDTNDKLSATEHMISSGNMTIDYIVDYKLKKAKSIGTECKCETDVLCEIELTPLELTTLLGNLLDNALEALEKVSERKMEVDISAQKGILKIRVGNTFDGSIKLKRKKDNSISVDNILSSKAETSGHGIGLRNVERIIEDHRGNISIKCDNGWFEIVVVLLT